MYNNQLGGRICTTVFCTTDEFTPRGGVPRKEWLIKILEAIDSNAAEGTLLIEHPAMSISRRLPDGAVLLMLCNFGFDPIEQLDLKVTGAAKVSELTADGTWKDLKFTGNDGVVSVDRTMACYETLIIRIER